MTTVNITRQLLKDYFTYRDGHLWWKKSNSVNGKGQVGQSFGYLSVHGYICGTFFNNRVKEHRLIWLYHYGTWPNHNIDHINGIRDDNRIENLRDCEQKYNTHNRCADKDTSSTYKGVYWLKRNRKWRAMITANGKRISLGCYDSEIEAAKAYDKSAKYLHGEYGRLNYG